MRLKSALICAVSASSFCFAGEYVVNLKNPTFSSGVLQTSEGGVITAKGMRLQARHIAYTNRMEEGELVQKVWAKGDLMMEYEGRIFVGEEISFDLITRTGFLTCGKTCSEGWYIGGDRVELCSDGSFYIYGAYVTTVETTPPSWAITAEDVKLEDHYLLSARKVRFEYGNVPIFWLPSFRSNLKWFTDPSIRFRILWDKGLGPRFSARYRIYSWENLQMFLRFDLRWSNDLTKFKEFSFANNKFRPGGAFEADYLSDDKRTLFQTKNYGAYDKSFPNENGFRRYRLQGLLNHVSEDGCNHLHAQWDRMSDDRMVNDFKDSDFEINTQKSTYATLNHFSDPGFVQLSVRPKINPFQSLNQELPDGRIGLRPFELIPGTGIISENFASGSFFDYTFANQLDKILKDRRAGRLETANSLYRPFHFGAVNLTPKAGIVGIYYTKSPSKEAIGQFLLTYGGELSTRLIGHPRNVIHQIEPYFHYLGYSRPQAAVDRVFIFDIDDGYTRLDQLRFGVRQSFYPLKNNSLRPRWMIDLYGYGFFGAKSFTDQVPKLFADIEFNQPTYAFYGKAVYNIQENVLDTGNVGLLWTANENFAMGVEFRHRSKFFWRKAILDSYVLDFARPLDELLDSPLSDGRNTLLTKAHFYLTPRWNLHLQTHHGWGRADEPRYNGVKVDLNTLVTGSYEMQFSYEYIPNDPVRFSYKFKLLK